MQNWIPQPLPGSPPALVAVGLAAPSAGGFEDDGSRRFENDTDSTVWVGHNRRGAAGFDLGLTGWTEVGAHDDAVYSTGGCIVVRSTCGRVEPAQYGTSRERDVRPDLLGFAIIDGGPGRHPEAGSCRGGVEGLHRGERSDPTAPQVRVVIDASELGLEAVIYAILGVLVGVPLAGLIIAALASRLGRRRFGFGSIAMGIVVSIATLVVVVVLWRTIGGEVTGWDLLWATGLTVAAAWSLRRLALRPQASTART